MELIQLSLNLGCPYYCEDDICVDLHPLNDGVIQSDALEYLKSVIPNSIEKIYSKNLLEHITDIGGFISNCHRILIDGGRLTIITDNAEFIPFYFPFWINHTGIGAHARDEYAQDISHNITHHYMIFTKMHLFNFFKYYGFRDIQVKRITFGARLQASGIK